VDGILSNYPVDSPRTPRFAVTMSSFVNFDDELAFLEASGHNDLGRDETDEMLLQHQLITLPLLNFAALRHHAEAFPSRGLLGTMIGADHSVEFPVPLRPPGLTISRTTRATRRRPEFYCTHSARAGRTWIFFRAILMGRPWLEC
jgi:hypothetical protein